MNQLKRNGCRIVVIVILILLICPKASIVTAAVPTVNTLPSTTVKADSASVGGEVLSDNGSPIIERGIIYSLNSNPAIGGTKIKLGSTLGKYYYRLTGLIGNSRYYYAAYAINADGISYGITRSFATKKDAVAPYIIGATVSPTNNYIDINLNEYVFGANRTPITLNSFRWTFNSNGGGGTSLTVTSITKTDGTPITSSVMNVRLWFNVTGIPSGVETLQIWPVNGTSIYDSSGNVMLSTSTTGQKYLNDKNSPQIVSGSLAANNTYMDVAMSQNVYGVKKTPLTVAQFALSFYQNGGTASGVTIVGVSNTQGGNLVGGETIIRVLLNVKGTPSGDEMIAIGPLNGNSIYDENGNPMSSTQTTGSKQLNDLLSPAIAGALLEINNSYVDISFTQGVYSSSMEALSPNDLKLIFSNNGGNATSVIIDRLTRLDGTAVLGGEMNIRVYLRIDKQPSGVETIEIFPAGISSIIDINGNAMLETQRTGIMTLYDRLKPVIVSGKLSTENDYVDMVISEGIYNASKGAIEASNLTLTFNQNGGGTTAVSINKLSRLDGSPLIGGETSIRVYLTLVGIPSGVETITIKPASMAALYDKVGNSMNSTETTGVLYLNSKSPIKRLTHLIKTATGKIASTREITYIVGDKISRVIKLEINSLLVNPKLVVNLDSNNENFYFKEIKTSAGLLDTSSVKVYKNGVKLSNTLIIVSKNQINNSLYISINQNFTTNDLVEVIYITKLGYTDIALHSKTRPALGATIKSACFVEWGSPVRYYSLTNPGPTGNDQFYTNIIVKASRVLK